MRVSGRTILPYAALVSLMAVTLWAFNLGQLPPADFTFCNGDEIKTIDPVQVTGQPEGQIVRALFEGLVGWHPETLEPVPGAAERWDISDDKLTYTFHLRDDALWSDGSPVVADDFVYSFRRLLHPATGCEYAYEMHYVENARKFTVPELKPGEPVEIELPRADNVPEHMPGEMLHGKLVQVEGADDGKTYVVDVAGAQRRFHKHGMAGAEPYTWLLFDFNAVAIHAIDAKMLRIKLENPTPYFLSLMGFYPLFPVNRACLERYGSPAWTKPENVVCNGPFLMQERRVRDRIRMVKNPLYWDRDNVHFETMDALAVKSTQTMLNMYLTGQVDWIRTVPSIVVPTLLEQGRDDFRPTPYFGTYFYRLNTTNPALKDPRVRKALSLALNRQEIVQRVTRGGQTPAYSLVPPKIKDYMPYESSLTETYNPAEAKRLLAEAGYPGGRGMPRFDILYNVHEDHQSIAELVQAQWQATLGIDVGLQQQEWAAYLEAQKSKQYGAARAAWIGDYVDPNTFLNMFVTDGGNNQTGWGNRQYDQLIDQAHREADVEKRLSLFTQAERILMDELPLIPVYHYVNLSMVRPYVKGFYPNVQDMHPYQGMKIDQDEKRRVLEGLGF